MKKLFILLLTASTLSFINASDDENVTRTSSSALATATRTSSAPAENVSPVTALVRSAMFVVGAESSPLARSASSAVTNDDIVKGSKEDSKPPVVGSKNEDKK